MMRIGLYVGLLLGIMGAFGFVYRAGRSAAQSECDSAALQAQLAVVRGDLARAEEAADRAAKQKVELEKQTEQTTGKIDDLERELTARDAALANAQQADVPPPAPVDGKCPAPARVQPDRVYRASPDDIRRLRAITAD